jgi:hypothetical protein
MTLVLFQLDVEGWIGIFSFKEGTNCSLGRNQTVHMVAPFTKKGSMQKESNFELMMDMWSLRRALWFHCFWAWGESEHHGRECVVEESVHLMVF